MVGYEPRLDVSSYHKRIFTDRYYTDSLAAPVVQVFGVEIITNFGDGKPCEIYGSIEAFEKTRYCSDLYRRGREDYEEMKEGRGPLSLIGPSDVPIFATMTATLNFCLKDNIRGVKLIDGKLSFNPSDDDSYDQLLTYDLRGPHGLARVYYVVFRFAHLFKVDIKVTTTDNDDKNGIGHDIYIFGSIVASYPNDSMKRSDSMKRLEAKLFNIPSDKPSRVMAGKPTILSRNVVAAPLYSSLVLNVHLRNSNKKVIAGCLQFPANNYGGQNLQHIQTEYASVAVQIKLACPVKLSSKVFHDQRLSVPRGPSIAPEPRTSCAVEIFSVFVRGIAKEITSLCGVILIDDGDDDFSIYNRDDKDRETLTASRLASIEVNYRAIWNMEFRIYLYLRDPDANLEVCRGKVSWNIDELEHPDLSSYPKRICSLVQGDDGYAAVHYSIFFSAYGASVQFELKLTTPDYENVPLLLYGTMFGRYGGEEYPTRYDEKYYRSRLFDRAKEQPVRVQFDEKVTMLKSVVVVPEGSSLIIDADLGIVNGEEFKGSAEFHSNVLPQSMTLRGTHFDIKVSVEFIP